MDKSIWGYLYRYKIDRTNTLTFRLLDIHSSKPPILRKIKIANHTGKIVFWNAEFGGPNPIKKNPIPYRRRHGRSRQIGNGCQRSGRKRTGAGLLLGELVDEDAYAERVRSLGGDEEVVVVVDDEADKDERGHAGDDG